MRKPTSHHAPTDLRHSYITRQASDAFWLTPSSSSTLYSVHVPIHRCDAWALTSNAHHDSELIAPTRLRLKQTWRAQHQKRCRQGASTTPQQRAQHQQHSRQGEQLQLNNETHDLSCATDAAVDLAADTHIFFFPLLTCVVSQFKYVLAWMNQPPTWYLSTLCLRFFTLAFVPTCRHHDSHRHCRQTVTDFTIRTPL